MEGDIELDIWHGDWGLPTVEPKCLAVLTYCKFSGVPVIVRKTGNPLKSPSGELPVLRHGNEIQGTTEDILNYLREHQWGCDNKLSNIQCADTIAFCSLLEEKLLPAILHLWWIDGKNYIDLTRPGFAKASPFPLNFILPGNMRRKARLRIYSKNGENVTDGEVDLRIYKDAKQCLNLLSKKLGNAPFFFGDRPSSFDAFVFGYLAPIMKAPLSNNQLQSHLLACPNLTHFCKRILKDYFPNDIYENEKKKENTKKQMSGLAEDNPNKTKNMILAGIFAITAMVGYAFAIGLIQIELSDKESEEEENPELHKSQPETDKHHENQQTYEQFEPLFEEPGGEE
ncbi:MTX [Acanthosepion pharaonis]|uniref:Metaxin n=1 Tax=Acanthosepion pharaonis TaxID=158019 RepID=A0A812C0Q3_ACAPH|nr:MTX [Sepia pharaonis]